MQLIVMLVFLTESLELIDNLIIPTDPLVDDKQLRLRWEHYSYDDPQNFCFHSKPPLKKFRPRVEAISIPVPVRSVRNESCCPVLYRTGIFSGITWAGSPDYDR